MYLLLANTTALFHASLVLTVLVGTCLVVARASGRMPRAWWWAYAAAMLGMVVSQALIGDCILTVWEKDLRNLARPGSAYHDSFLGHYLPFLPGPVLRVAGPVLVLAALFTIAHERLRRKRAAKLS